MNEEKSIVKIIEKARAAQQVYEQTHDTQLEISGLHNWKRLKKSEPLICNKCGIYYGTKEATKPCPA